MALLDLLRSKLLLHILLSHLPIQVMHAVFQHLLFGSFGLTQNLTQNIILILNHSHWRHWLNTNCVVVLWAVDIRGITVSFLRTFVEENKAQLLDMTTADVCSKIIKPNTEREGVSYVELLQRKGKPVSIGNAVLFVSHAWACKFLSVVETIFQKCKDDHLDESLCVIWFDIFSVS